MMKTKLTLFVTVLAAALFLGGCASTYNQADSYNQADLVEKAGIWHHKDTDKPINGLVIEYHKGKNTG